MKEYKLGEKTLVWDFDENEPNVAKLPLDNLYIKDLWNMKDTIGEGELCTGLRIIDDKNFMFTTFNCICYIMHLENNEVQLITQFFTK